MRGHRPVGRPTRFRADACGRRWPCDAPFLLKRGVAKRWASKRFVVAVRQRRLRTGSMEATSVSAKQQSLDGSARLAGI